MLAQRLRHRVTISELVTLQDPNTGAKTEDFLPLFINEPAEVYALSGREFIAASTTQAEVTTRITVRRQAGEVRARMRVEHDGALYNIAAVLPDFKERQWLTLMCSVGINDG